MVTVLEDQMTLGAWIESERSKRGWSQVRLQVECYTFDPDNIVRENDISRYESDSREPTVAKLAAIAKAFDVPVPLHLLSRRKGRYLSFSLTGVA